MFFLKKLKRMTLLLGIACSFLSTGLFAQSLDQIVIKEPGLYPEGLVYHPDNYLIVGKYDEGKIFKIPLNDKSNITEITLNQAVNTVDGLLLRDKNTLILVSNNLDLTRTSFDFEEAVYEITTTDDWVTATIDNVFIAPFGTFPTVVEEVDDNLYVINSFISTLFASEDGDDAVDEFPIQKISF